MTNEQRGNQPKKARQSCCSIIELRQYTLRPGKRDVLIALFEREFIESQETLGMTLVGQFRDLDDPNRFVWLRGFPDMRARSRALEGFYEGPVWKAHSNAANATMIDSDNVLLLRPALPGSEFQFRNDRPSATAKAEGLIIATIYYFAVPVTGDFESLYERMLKPALVNAGASILACFVTEHSVNTFPRLPVREGENVLVWFASFRDEAAYADHETALFRSQRWRNELSPELERRLSKWEALRLSPTARSRLRWEAT